MKKFILLFVLIFSAKTFAQEIKDEQTKIHYTTKPEFPGGNKAFTSEFLKMVYAYIDMEMYAVNGKFTFLFDIDEKGKITIMNIIPKVKNDELFRDDMQFAMRKVKTKWKPATKDGIPIKSRYILIINFTSDHFDYGN